MTMSRAVPTRLFSDVIRVGTRRFAPLCPPYGSYDLSQAITSSAFLSGGNTG